MPTRLIAIAPWVVCVVLGIVLFYFIIDKQYLENEINALSADNARIAEQRNTVISVNHSMHETIQLMKQQLNDAQDAADRLREVKAAMDSKLNKAVSDIKRLTDGKAQNNSDCDDSFSSDVYQRMLDAYGAGDSSKE